MSDDDRDWTPEYIICAGLLIFMAVGTFIMTIW